MGVSKRRFMESEERDFMYDEAHRQWVNQSLYADSLEARQAEEKEELRKLNIVIEELKIRFDNHFEDLLKLKDDIDNSITIRQEKIERVLRQVDIKAQAKEVLYERV